MSKNYGLPEEVVNGVLQYLATRPFQEVEALISAIKSEAFVVEEEVEDVAVQEEG